MYLTASLPQLIFVLNSAARLPGYLIQAIIYLGSWCHMITKPVFFFSNDKDYMHDSFQSPSLQLLQNYTLLTLKACLGQYLPYRLCVHYMFVVFI